MSKFSEFFKKPVNEKKGIYMQILEKANETQQAALDGLIGDIYQWGLDRCIIQNATYEVQWLKLLSEIGELADNLAKGKPIYDDIGDCFVVLVMMQGIRGYSKEDIIEWVRTAAYVVDACEETRHDDDMYRMKSILLSMHADSPTLILQELMSFDVSFTECALVAYEDIKDRKGTLTKDGIFVKYTK